MQKVEIDVTANTSKATKAIDDLNNSLEQIAETGDRNREGFEVLDKATGGYASQVKDLAGSITGAIKGAKGFAKSLKGVRGALLATGVGAIVVALGLIVAYWDDIKGLVSGVSSEQEESLGIQKESVALAEQQMSVTSEMENTLKLQGKSEKEIRDLKKQQLNDTISALEVQLEQEKQIKASQVAAAERNKSILMGFITLVSAPIVAALALIDAASQGLAKLGVIEEATNLAQGFVEGTAELIFDPEEVAEEGDKAIEETEKKLRQLKNKRDGFILQDQKEELDRINKANDEKLKAEEDYQKRLADLKKRIRDAEANTEEERRALELKKIEEHNKALMAEALANGLLSQELIDSLNETLQAKKDQFAQEDREKAQDKRFEELELDREFEALTFDEQRNILAQRRAIALEDETLSDEQKLELKKQFSDAEIALAQAEADAKDKLLGETAGVLQKFSGIAGKETAAGKALGIASATINTYRGVSDALAATTVTPFETALKFANAGAILASGIQNVKKIVSVKVPNTGGGGGGGATGGGAISQPPSFNIVGATETSQLADAVAGQEQQPVQAYVVSNDITTAQSLENNIVEGATL